MFTSQTYTGARKTNMEACVKVLGSTELLDDIMNVTFWIANNFDLKLKAKI